MIIFGCTSQFETGNVYFVTGTSFLLEHNENDLEGTKVYTCIYLEYPASLLFLNDIIFSTTGSLS